MSEKRTVMRVSPDKADGGWNVKREGTGQATYFNKKDPAVEYAKSVAKAASLGQIKVANREGKLQYEITHDKDPRRRPG
jgi:hypothetical protein